MRSIHQAAALAATLAALNAPLAHAAYCDTAYSSTGLTVLEGDTVCFLYEPAAVDPLYGSLGSGGDSIYSTPVNFDAHAQDGASANTEGTGTVYVVAKSGFVLDGVSVGEGGIYRTELVGDSVDVDATLRVFAKDDPNIVSGTNEWSNLALDAPFGFTDSQNETWFASTNVDLTGSKWDGFDYIGLTLTNNLSADAASGGDALIKKLGTSSSVDISVDTSTVVPLPAAVWLFGSGLLGLVGIARRRAG